jgi:hypothetical protein
MKIKFTIQNGLFAKDSAVVFTDKPIRFSHKLPTPIIEMIGKGVIRFKFASEIVYEIGYYRTETYIFVPDSAAVNALQEIRFQVSTKHGAELTKQDMAILEICNKHITHG